MDRQPLTFQNELERLLGIKLQLKINDNRSTMLSVKWEPDTPKVSLHRLFLGAPRNIMEELACYIVGKKNIMPANMKAYIDNNLRKYDYSWQLDLKQLQTQGKVYDLKDIYENINKDYFSRKMNLAITWYGQPRLIKSAKATFGLYVDSLKLIKIHRQLDQKRFPEYVVAFVVYHEMLHHCCLTHIDNKGTRHIHSKEFKLREKEFYDYDRAQNWLKRNQNIIFGGFTHGRT